MVVCPGLSYSPDSVLSTKRTQTHARTLEKRTLEPSPGPSVGCELVW